MTAKEDFVKKKKKRWQKWGNDEMMKKNKMKWQWWRRWNDKNEKEKKNSETKEEEGHCGTFANINSRKILSFIY